MEPDLDHQVLFLLILHLVNHSVELFAGLVNSSLVSFNPHNGDTTASVRNVICDISLRLNLVNGAATLANHHVFVALGIILHISKSYGFNKFISLRFQCSLGFLSFIQRTINFDAVNIIEDNVDLLKVLTEILNTNSLLSNYALVEPAWTAH